MIFKKTLTYPSKILAWSVGAFLFRNFILFLLRCLRLGVSKFSGRNAAWLSNDCLLSRKWKKVMNKYAFL